MTLPTVALSIRQPWAWLIVEAAKDIENRSWWTKFRGPVLIHAGKTIDRDCLGDLFEGRHPVTGEPLPAEFYANVTYGAGGIVGVAEITDCVSQSVSPWFVGPYGFVLANARPLPFMPMRGQLGFFACEYAPPSHEGEARP